VEKKELKDKMKINIIGSILGTSGYDNHCKGLANALYKLNPNIKLDVPLSPNWGQLVNDAELAMIKTEPRTPDVTIAIMTPPNWRIALADNCKKFIGFCVWEGDSCPLYWIEYLYDRRVNMIWCPSEHTKQAILNTLERNKDKLNNEDIQNIQDKIRIVPHGVDLNIFNCKK